MLNPIYQHIQDNSQDGVIFKANVLLAEARDDIHLTGVAMENIAQMVSLMESEWKREDYANSLQKANKKIKASLLTKRINAFVKERSDQEQEVKERESVIPRWINKEKFYTVGFDSKIDGIDNTGVYFHMGEKGARKLTNFVINPLIHIYSKDEASNRRLTEVNNGVTKAVLELPSKAFSSVDQFESIMMNEGVYFLEDGFTKSHLNKMKSQLLREYPKCFELKTLGWQPEGFWSYANRIYKDGTVTSFNEYGFAEVDGVNYLSMAASSLASDTRAEDDLYENDRFLEWSPPVIDFKEWSKMMLGAYGENAKVAIFFVFLSLFRDIVYSLNSSCPHFYAYGPVGSGKSAIAESISNVFFKGMKFFNLNQGTDFAFFNRLERFRNCPVGFNEFDENAIKEEWFRAIKAAYDGEGREKGSMTRKKKTEMQKILCTLILCGQYLSTKDDASVLSRCLPSKISAGDRPDEQVATFQRLKAYEKVGLGGILVELLQHRKLVENGYSEAFAAEFKKLSMAFKQEGIKVKARIHNNFCTCLAMMSLLKDKIAFPFSYDDFFQLVKSEIIKLSQMITESDSLAAFWKLIEFLSEQNTIEEGWDFKVEMKDEIPLMISRTDRGEDGKDTKMHRFEEPRKLLFLRMTTIHPLYMQAIRSQTGKTGLNQETIVTYFKDHEAFIGMIKSTQFKSKKGAKKTSNAFVLDYDLLGLNLERTMEPIGEDKLITGEVRYMGAEVIDVLGILKVKWLMEEDRGYEKDGVKVSKLVQITCYSELVGNAPRLTVGTKLKVRGSYTERTVGDTLRGELMVDIIEFLSVGGGLEVPTPVDGGEVEEGLNF